MSIYGPRSELDLVAVKRDDDALDVLARRQAREPLSADVLDLLAALTADVDAGLAELLATPLRVPLRSAATGEIPSPSDVARRRTARVVTATLIVGGLVSVSGVSAAVTGDPFTPYRSVISTVSGGDQNTAPVEDTGPSVHQQILSIGAAIDAGQFARARAGIQRLHATLDEKPRGAQRAAIAQLAALEAKLARAEALAAKKADVPKPTLPTAANSHAIPTVPPGLVKKPVSKPKSKPPVDKAKPPRSTRTSAGTTSQPRQRASEKTVPAKGDAAAQH